MVQKNTDSTLSFGKGKEDKNLDQYLFTIAFLKNNCNCLQLHIFKKVRKTMTSKGREGRAEMG